MSGKHPTVVQKWTRPGMYHQRSAGTSLSRSVTN